jgi:hypothetical protein
MQVLLAVVHARIHTAAKLLADFIMATHGQVIRY